MPGTPTKFPLLEIQRHIHTVRDRSAKAAELIDLVVDGNGDLDLVLVVSQNVEDEISKAVRLIYRYKD